MARQCGHLRHGWILPKDDLIQRIAMGTSENVSECLAGLRFQIYHGTHNLVEVLGPHKVAHLRPRVLGFEVVSF